MDIDLDKLTLAEIEELEELTGKAIDVLFDGPKGKLMRALFFVVTKRTDPTYTFEQTAGLTINEVTAALNPSNDLVD